MKEKILSIIVVALSICSICLVVSLHATNRTLSDLKLKVEENEYVLTEFLGSQIEINEYLLGE